MTNHQKLYSVYVLIIILIVIVFGFMQQKHTNMLQYANLIVPLCIAIVSFRYLNIGKIYNAYVYGVLAFLLSAFLILIYAIIT